MVVPQIPQEVTSNPRIMSTFPEGSPRSLDSREGIARTHSQQGLPYGNTGANIGTAINATIDSKGLCKDCRGLCMG